MNDFVFSHLCREKPSLILITIYNTNDEVFAMELSRMINTSYAYMVETLFLLERAGLLYFERSGRRKYVALTDKGRNIAEALNFVRVTL